MIYNRKSESFGPIRRSRNFSILDVATATPAVKKFLRPCLGPKPSLFFMPKRKYFRLSLHDDFLKRGRIPAPVIPAKAGIQYALKVWPNMSQIRSMVNVTIQKNLRFHQQSMFTLAHFRHFNFLELVPQR